MEFSSDDKTMTDDNTSGKRVYNVTVNTWPHRLLVLSHDTSLEQFPQPDTTSSRWDCHGFAALPAAKARRDAVGLCVDSAHAAHHNPPLSSVSSFLICSHLCMYLVEMMACRRSLDKSKCATRYRIYRAKWKFFKGIPGWLSKMKNRCLSKIDITKLSHPM